TNEIEKATCAETIVLSPNAMPAAPNKPAVENPITISGMMTGRDTIPSIARMSLPLPLTSASAAAVPMVVEIAVVRKPTIKLIRTDATNSLSLQAKAYHRQVNPRQIVLNREPLNDK